MNASGYADLLAKNVAGKVGELEQLLPQDGGLPTRRALDRVRDLLRPLSQ